MTSTAISRNAYTDAPEPHLNLFLGSLQLMFWLFFHPSAWRHHMTRIDPSLRPDFALADLGLQQWKNSALRRLLVQCGVWLLMTSLVLIVGLWFAPVPTFSRLFLAGGGIAAAIVFSASIGTVNGVAIAAVGSTVCLVTIPIIFLGTMESSASMISSAFSTALSLTSGTAASIAIVLSGNKIPHSHTRQVAGIITGLLLGGVSGLVILNVIFLAMSNDTLVLLVGGIAGAIMGGVGFQLRSKNWLLGAILGVLGGLLSAWAFNTTDFVFGSASGVLGGFAFAMFFSAAYALPYTLAQRVGGTTSGAIAGGLSGGVAIWLYLNLSYLDPSSGLLTVATPVVIAATWPWWRPWLTYLPELMTGLLLLRSEEYRRNDRSSFLRWHPAFWDEFQRLPLFGLDEHVVLVAERNPAEGQAAIEYLSTSRQRWAAQAAQIELDARELGRCSHVMDISQTHHSLAAGELVGPASALLRSLSRISQDVDSALHQEGAYNRRLALSAVEDRLDGLLRELTRSSEQYAVRFRPIADGWRQIVANHVRDLAEATELRQEIDNPYVIGVPLTDQQEIFIGRSDISARIEQLLLDRRRPPLLLYGQRRMGKTSLLNNLGRLLPSTIIPLFVDLQGPASYASDHAGFLYNIARYMADSVERQRDIALPPLARETLAIDPFTRFDEWLDEVEGALGEDTALLALDEFEALDGAITEGRFDEGALLGTLRHLIQHRPRFKVLLAGSHTLDELQRWSSYLINVQVVHISYLKEDEALQLIERPVKDFALRYEPDASQRVLALTRGHPALLQLLCSEIVALKNEQPIAVRRLARLADVEAAVPEALSHGSFFFADIERNQVNAAGLAVLHFMTARGEGAVVSREVLASQFPDELEQALGLLLRRELIESVDGGYRFQVELIRRWFAQNTGI